MYFFDLEESEVILILLLMRNYLMCFGHFVK